MRRKFGLWKISFKIWESR